MLKAMLREMRQRGDAFSVLFPFRDSFYRKLGYGVIEVARQMAFSPTLLPASDEARRVRRLMLPDRPSVAGAVRQDGAGRALRAGAAARVVDGTAVDTTA